MLYRQQPEEGGFLLESMQYLMDFKSLWGPREQDSNLNISRISIKIKKSLDARDAKLSYAGKMHLQAKHTARSKMNSEKRRKVASAWIFDELW